MAIYKGRSVQIISITPPVEPRVLISTSDGNIQVNPGELQFTKVELDKIQKEKAAYYTYDAKNPGNTHYRLVDEKTHQEIVDGQDPVKVEKKMRENPVKSDITIPAQTIKVTPEMVAPSKTDKPVVNTPVPTVSPQTTAPVPATPVGAVAATPAKLTPVQPTRNK